jgi:hypothetical protein
MSVMLVARKEGCLSDLSFDQMLAGELTEAANRKARAHVDDCASCRNRLAAISRDHEAFAGEPPLVFKKRPSRARGVWVMAGGALAMAAAALLFVRTKPPGDEMQGTRVKGAGRIGFYVKRGEDVTLGMPGAHLRPGDALRFVYTTDTSRHLTILSIDGAGHASVYYPSGAVAAQIEPGVDKPLPTSVVLDATLGEEKVFALFCQDAVSLEPIRAMLEASPARPPSAPGCQVDTVFFQKEDASRP